MIRVDKEGVITRDMTIDSALTGLFKFGLVEATGERMRRTMNALEDHLLVKSEVGGVARYENDPYHQVSKDIESIPGIPGSSAHAGWPSTISRWRTRWTSCMPRSTGCAGRSSMRCRVACSPSNSIP